MEKNQSEYQHRSHESTSILTEANNSTGSFLATLKQGIITSLPVVIFLGCLYLIIKLVVAILAPINAILFGNPEIIYWPMHLISLAVLLALFIGLGFLVGRRGGQEKYDHFHNKYLSRIPLFPMISDTVGQFTRLSQMPFSQVVLVDPFGTGVMLTGFVTENIDNDIYTVFVPTAPNPTNGNIYHVPKSKLVFLTVKSETALRTIVGMGTGSSYLFNSDNLKEFKQKEEFFPLPEAS